MAFFSSFRHLRLKPQGRTPTERLLRSLALLALFILIIWLFWSRAEQNLARVMAKGAILDQTTLVTPEQVDKINSLAAVFKEHFGLDLRMLATDDQDILPPKAHDAKTIFIAVNPVTGESVIDLPLLVANSLGADFAPALKARLFTPPLGPDWPENLVKAGSAILNAMLALREDRPENRRAPDQGRPHD